MCWALEAGRTPSTEAIAAIVTSGEDDPSLLPDAVLMLFAALGFTPRDLDYLRLRDRLWSSVYGGGATRDELVAHYQQLAARWKQ